jgi:hypothetical protein
MRVVRGDRGAGVFPGGIGGEGFQLPPVGVDAKVIEALDDLGAGLVIGRADLRRDDFQQHFQPVAAAGVEQAQDGVFLFRLGFRVVVGVVEAQHLDHMLQRPFGQPAEIRADLGFQHQRARAGPFHRTPDPEAGARRLEQRIAAKAAVAEDAIAGLATRHLQRGLQAQLLEGADLGGGGPLHRLKLHPVVEGEDPHGRPVLVPVRRPMHLLQRRILAQGLLHLTPRFRKNCNSSQLG